MDFPQTPVVRLDTDENGNELWIKRDDLLPFCFGGNKARIAAELVDDMLGKGKNHMIAYGNARSNLCRALANLCAARGLACTVLSPADDDGSREDSYNLLMARSLGAEIVPCLKTDVPRAVDAALAASEARGLKPYYLYGDRTGGGNREAPTRAYRKVWRELLEQQRMLGFAFDEVYLASATGMTQAGLLRGRCELGGETRVVGLSVARGRDAGEAHIRGYLRASLGDARAAEADVDFVDDYAMRYGAYSPDMVECARDAFRRYGVPLDLTYTGKAFFGMRRELLRRGRHGLRVLFLHTGGTPLFFDKAREILGEREPS